MNENKLEKNLLSDEQKRLEQEIIEEGKKLLKEDPADWLGFLNNFYTSVIPENKSSIRTRRNRDQEAGWWNKKHREFIGNNEKYSDLWLNQTPQEFYATIDRVIEEVDANGEINRAIDIFCNSNTSESQEKLEEKLIPVFARLVAMGYTHYELRG